MRPLSCLLLAALTTRCGVCRGQFALQESHTKASLRGIDALSDTVAWASGSGGTVLLTVDGGANWKTCAVPKGGEKLDFRGVQGFDADTAVVMASGKGPLSRVYKTADGCATWKSVFEDPDADGFFDALRRVTGRQMYLMGDPVDGRFAMFFSADQGTTWFIADDPGREAAKNAGGFAASNSALASAGPFLMFGTSATETAEPKVYFTHPKCPAPQTAAAQPAPGRASAQAAAAPQVACSIEWVQAPVPLGTGASSSGVFSLAVRAIANERGVATASAVAIGGDYAQPDKAANTAAFSIDGGRNWQAAVTSPGGYRSAVAYDKASRRWVAVGPSGADTSLDGGRNWTPLKPSTGDAAESDKGWNAISFPFVVGAKGRIGRLEESALK